MKQNMQKLGGISALYAGVAYIAGILGFLLIVGWPDDPAEQVMVLREKQVSLHILYLIVYQIWAVFLVMLVLSLNKRFKKNLPVIMHVATAIGLMWATVVVASGMIFNIGMDNVVKLYDVDHDQAILAWIMIDSVCNGLGGGNEILGGLWMLLISFAAMQTGGLPRFLNYIGLATGVAGILSALPGYGDAGLAFGLIQIVWFLWLGFFLLRKSHE